MEMSGQLHTPTALPPRERTPGTHGIGGWVSPIAGLDSGEEKNSQPLPGLQLTIIQTTSILKQ